MFRQQLLRPATRISLTRNFTTSVPRWSAPQPSQPQPPQQQPQQPQHGAEPEEKPINPHAAFYRDFGGPIVKALAFTFSTYYGLMYLWEYLDSQEENNK